MSVPESCHYNCGSATGRRHGRILTRSVWARNPLHTRDRARAELPAVIMAPAGHLPVSTPGDCEVTETALSPDLVVRPLLLHTRLSPFQL
eukprot:364173-Chlamydomonas_euryale.AAC.2